MQLRKRDLESFYERIMITVTMNLAQLTGVNYAKLEFFNRHRNLNRD